MRFLHKRKLVIFHWSLSDNKSPQVSSILLSILADLNNAVVWMVSTHTPIRHSYSLFNKLLSIVLRTP